MVVPKHTKDRSSRIEPLGEYHQKKNGERNKQTKEKSPNVQITKMKEIGKPKKTSNVHHEMTVSEESILGQWFGKKIRALDVRPCINYPKLPRATLSRIKS